MLTVDQVRARRRGNELQLLRLGGPTRALALELAERYIAIARAAVGKRRQDFDEACAAVAVPGQHRRLAAGLLKLVGDRCEFEAEPGVDPVVLRQALFQRAAARRAALGHQEPFPREALIAEVAAEQGLSAEELSRLLYADLRGAHRLLAFAALEPEALVEQYQLAQAQAVLLRAVRVEAEVTCRSPLTFRHLFFKLKFHRLLFSAERLAEGTYRVVVDGPHSLFRSVTKYGLQFALLLPALRRCDRWSLRAELLWGKARSPLTFSLAGRGPGAGEGDGAPAAEPLRPEVAALLERFAGRDGPWRAEPCAELLTLPGVGLCVPDLRFTHAESGAEVYCEVLGFWSREAVWKRVDLVSAPGFPHRILFAVSSRLRVGEGALPEEAPGALYVFKGALMPGAVEARLDRLARTNGSP